MPGIVVHCAQKICPQIIIKALCKMAQSCRKTQLTSVRCIIFKILIMLRNGQWEEEATFLFFMNVGLKLIFNKLLRVAQVREKSTGLDCWRRQCLGLVVLCKKSLASQKFGRTFLMNKLNLHVMSLNSTIY
jgi:hypothetical protein